MDFRAIVADEVEQHLDVYRSFIPDEEVDHRLAAIRKDAEWGDHLELVAFSQALKINVICYSLDQIEKRITVVDAQATIELAYLCGNHYDLLVDEDLAVEEETFQLRQERQASVVEAQESNKATTRASSGSSQIINAMNEGQDDGITLSSMLKTVLRDHAETNKWLEEVNLIHSRRECPACKTDMKRRLTVAGRPDGDFFCTKCHRRLSPRCNNFLSSLRLPTESILQIIFHWFFADGRQKTAKETHVSERTITRYRDRLLAACVLLLMKHNKQIGGRNRVVEIEECLLHRRKYRRGRLKDSGWVLGGIERPITESETPRIFLVPLTNRKRETLERHIRRWVAPDTIIITDCFKGYDHLQEAGYSHLSVNHSKNFVDPKTTAHTQRIEGLWHWVRSHAIPRSGAKLEDLDLYLAAYMYKRFINNSITHFLKDLASLSAKEVLTMMKTRHSRRKAQDDTSESSETASDDEESTEHSTQSQTDETELTESLRASESHTPVFDLPQDHKADYASDRTPEEIVAETYITSPRKKSRTLQAIERKLEEEEPSTAEKKQRVDSFQVNRTRYNLRSSITKTARKRRASLKKELEYLRRY